jgi:S1-C subfamily serine protease
LGTNVALNVFRSGQNITLSMKLIAPPEEPRRETIELAGRTPFTGATIVNLSPATQEELSIEGFKSGVAVAHIQDDSIAASWLQKGDVILTVNGTKVQRTADLREIASSRPSLWKISIGRNGEVLTSVFR